MTATDQPWRPLDHEPHTFTLSPDSERLCICGLAETHHRHLGISSAACTYTCCHPDMCRRCHLPFGGGRPGTCKCPADPIPDTPAELLEDR